MKEITNKNNKTVKNIHVGHNSGNNEWYTPKEYIDAARRVMGEIDVDPSSTEQANKVVMTKKFYTKESDGLTKEWKGNVWMNPPYAQPLISLFSAELVKKIKSKEVKQALVLVNNATETKWFQEMVNICNAVCLISGRVRFLDPSGRPGAPLQGQIVLYFGAKVVQFTKEFSNFGSILWKK